MDANEEDAKLTTEELIAQIEQEENLKLMMETSARELQNTIGNMEEKFISLDEEGNEWKTRYETQIEINNRLNWQVGDLKRKLQQKTSTNKRNIDDITGNKLRGLVKQLEKEKLGTVNQLRNLEWRLDQESKALHKALDKRKKYQTGINEASYNLNSYQRLQKSDEIKKYQLGHINSKYRR